MNDLFSLLQRACCFDYFFNILYDKVSARQALHIHTQTDGNDIRPHTAHIYNECTSTDLNLVTV